MAGRILWGRYDVGTKQNVCRNNSQTLKWWFGSREWSNYPLRWKAKEFHSWFPCCAWVTHTDESKKERGWLHWRSGRFSAFDSLARQRKLTSVCSQGVQLARYGPSQVPNMNQINGWEQLRERGMGTMMCLSPSSAKVRARQKQICSSGWAENKPGGKNKLTIEFGLGEKHGLKVLQLYFKRITDQDRSGWFLCKSFWLIWRWLMAVSISVGRCETLCGDCVIFAAGCAAAGEGGSCARLQVVAVLPPPTRFWPRAAAPTYLQ